MDKLTRSPAVARIDAPSVETDRACDEFERRWRSGQPPDLAEFLKECGGGAVVDVERLRDELVRLDLELRWRSLAKRRAQRTVGTSRANELPAVEPRTALDYARQLLPAGSPPPASWLEAEYRARKLWGDPPAVQAFLDVNAHAPELTDIVGRVNSELAHSTRNFSGDPSAVDGRSLEVLCPQCRSMVSVVVDSERTLVCCQNCGSRFSLTDNHEETRHAQSLTTLDRFELIERLGVGGFGVVWKARDTMLDRTVAIKIPRRGLLTDEEIDRLRREAKAAARLDHPNIVPIYEVGLLDGVPYLVTAFVRGVPLNEWNSSGRLMAHRQAAELCRKLADALHHAHEMGIVHRDVKPANVMLDGDHEPHLMDFGLAKGDAGDISMTTEGQILGTPAYMSPEQARGSGDTADCRSDVYSLGAMLFEFVTGSLPFRGALRMLLHQVINDDPPAPRSLNKHVPLDLQTICLKSLEKDPARRYQTAKDLADDLGRFLNGEPIAARPVGALERRWRWCKRNPLVASLSAAAIGLLITVAAVSTIAYVRTSQALADKEVSAATARQVSDFLVNLFLSSTPMRFDGEQGFSLSAPDPRNANLTARQLLDAGAERIKTELGNQPAIQVALLTTVGDVYHGLGLFGAAVDQFRQALAVQQQLSPPGAPEIAAAKHRLAWALHFAGKNDDANAEYRDALEMYRARFGDESMEASIVMLSLGLLLTQQEQFAEAEDLIRGAIAIRERLRGRNDASVGFALAHLAAKQLAARQVNDAEATIARALLIASHDKKGDTALAAQVIGDYQAGVKATGAGDYQAAVVFLKRAVDQLKKVFGERHPFVAFVLFDYAIALEGSGDFEGAIQTLEMSVSLGTALMGPRYPLSMFAQLSLIESYYFNGDYDRAEATLGPLMNNVVEVYGNDSVQYADHLAMLALIQRKTDRVNAATAQMDVALSIFEAKLNEAATERWTRRMGILRHVANAMIEDDRLDLAQRAVASAEQIAAIARDKSGWADYLAASRARILARQGEVEKAIALLRAALRTLERKHGSTDFRTEVVAETLRELEASRADPS